jgi:hypothetical protein
MLALVRDETHQANPETAACGSCRDRNAGFERETFKYIDFPEAPEQQPCHLMRAAQQMSRRKSLY